MTELRYRRQGRILTGLAAALVSAWGTTQADYPIAGLMPDQRPNGAPVVKQVVKDPAWYQEALTGISRPYPASLGFLEDQGNWYTPFTRPGMPGRYDIRGWHTGD